MAIQRNSILGLMQDAPASKAARSLRLPLTMKNDVFLEALLDTPTAKHPHRSPLEWLGAMGVHIAVVAALIFIPLYTTATIHLSEYQAVPLVAPPPPAAPPAPPAASAIAPHMTHLTAKLNYSLQKLTAPSSIPKKAFSGSDNVAEAAPDLGVPGGVAGGQIGGVIGGVIGGTTGTTAPAPPPTARPAPRIVHAGAGLKTPRQIRNVDPVYPDLARQVHLSGTVVVDAVIDERGNVVQARAVSGHPLLIGEALKAVLQWKYESTTLNGQPVSVELQVQVHFNLNAAR